MPGSRYTLAWQGPGGTVLHEIVPACGFFGRFDWEILTFCANI